MSLVIGDNAHDNGDLTIDGTSLTRTVDGNSVTLNWTVVPDATKYTLWKKNVDRWVKQEDVLINSIQFTLDWNSNAEYSVSAMNGTRFIGNIANTVTVSIGINPSEQTVNELYGYSVGQDIDYKALYDGYDSYTYSMVTGHSKIVEIKPNTRIKFKLENGSYVAGNDITGIHVDSRPMYPLKNVFITTMYKEWTGSQYHYGVDNGYNSTYGGASPPLYAPYDCVITASRNLAQYNAQKTSSYDPPKGVYITFTYSYNGRIVTNQYEHMSEIRVSTGQTIKKGDILGWMGDTGEGGRHSHISTGNGNIDNQTTRKSNSTDPMNEYWFDSTYHLGDGTMTKYKKVNQDGYFFQLSVK